MWAVSQFVLRALTESSQTFRDCHYCCNNCTVHVYYRLNTVFLSDHKHVKPKTAHSMIAIAPRVTHGRVLYH